MAFGKKSWGWRPVAGFMAFWLLSLFVLPPVASAALVPSTSSRPGTGDRGLETELQAFLEQKSVAQRLLDLGLNPVDVKAKLSQLSPREIHYLATHLDQVQAGGDAAGAVIAVLLILILLVVLIKISGKQIIIK
ncbi:MAG: PA2779 family protein [candidate division NC10 bacterium]|nr:PA2779 family protein [candidate division NC10 bacterium]